jgi:hypothetical protein
MAPDRIGTVVRVDRRRGMGYVVRDDICYRFAQQDVIDAALFNELRRGMLVRFIERGSTKHGPRARHVTRA